MWEKEGQGLRGNLSERLQPIPKGKYRPNEKRELS